MPWFYCDACGDSIKKPKIAAHCRQCRTSSFTCIDCSRVFDLQSVQAHTSCVTEHEKYAQGATKPGGFAAKGFYGDGAVQSGGESAGNAAEGLEFLSNRAPWKCSICNVTCTSRETLLGHASGAKHKRRAKAAIAARNGGGSDAQAATNAGSEPEKSDKSDSEENKEQNGKQNKEKADKKKIKWKKLATAELKKSGGEMKSKKLLKAILAAAGDAACDEEKVLKKLERSKKFKIEGKTISLKA